GDGSTTGTTTQLADTGLSGVTALALGAYHSCAIVAGGAVRCWGSNGSGQLGTGDTINRTTPVAVFGLEAGGTALALGGGHSCAIVSGGAVQCWGYNFYGQLGNGSTINSATQVAVSGLTGAATFALGGSHSCAIVASRAVQCWGYNLYGQLGNSSTTSSTLPQDVIGSPFVRLFFDGFEG
ncbi:MAG: hypothetical protein ABIQ62_04805, partial [Thermomonas sp.]